jgi:hypothetical protein
LPYSSSRYACRHLCCSSSPNCSALFFCLSSPYYLLSPTLLNLVPTLLRPIALLSIIILLLILLPLFLWWWYFTPTFNVHVTCN